MLLNNVKAEKVRTGLLQLKHGSNIPFLVELSLAKIEPGRRSQVISLGGKGTDHFPAL